MKEIKEIIITDGIGAGINMRLGDLLNEEAMETVCNYINSHYIAKEKVKTLKVERTGIGSLPIVGSFVKEYGEGYNKAVSEINKKVDDLLGDLK